MYSKPFQLQSPFAPKGDQPRAIEELVAGCKRGDNHQTLLGITGSGKTFTIANLIMQTQRPALIMAPNKTLAAQLYSEFKQLFPSNAVHYFVSYYDYYQPEAYVPTTDTFIEKDSMINDEIDRMRHAATYALLSRTDVIIVASVSCIYGIGAQETYASMTCQVQKNKSIDRDTLLKRLIELQYKRNDTDFHRGTFRVRGDVIEIFPTYEAETAVRIELWGDEVESIVSIDPLRGKKKESLEELTLFPASHYATPKEVLERAMSSIREELRERLTKLSKEGKLLERQRLEQRTMYDLECIEQMGFCSGIENYSRHLTERASGQPPPTLMDYFPKNFLTIVDESHQTIPQIGAMFRGDRARKQTLVDHGFRLPSALDNRPLQFDEWTQRTGPVIYVSATPADYELDMSQGVIVEQVIRPTGLLDPKIEVRPVGNQVDDLLAEIRIREKKSQRVLVTTLTKRMSEDLTEYLADVGVRVQYLHSEIDTLERIKIIRALRKGEFDVLVGINLLREGLDIPEVSLVAILDADKEGFLRSTRSLIQTMGRAARNVEGQVILYAGKVTASMKQAIDTTQNRRKIQEAYNAEHNITPTSTTRSISQVETGHGDLDMSAVADAVGKFEITNPKQLRKQIEKLRKKMRDAAADLEFEKAATLRDKIRELQDIELTIR